MSNKLIASYRVAKVIKDSKIIKRVIWRPKY